MVKATSVNSHSPKKSLELLELPAFFIVGLVCFASLASLANAALPIENCADVWRVSFNQQGIFPSSSFDSGSPSTIKIAGKAEPYFFFEEGFNNSNQFDVVVAEQRNYMTPGEVVFKQSTQAVWFSLDADGKVFYDCALEGGSKTDEFFFEVKEKQFYQLTDGTSFAADSVIVKAKRPDAFRLRDDFVTNEFYVLTSRTIEGTTDYGAGSVFYKSPNDATKFELYYSYANGRQYARLTYVGCCNAPLATIAPSATPTAPSATPFAAPSLAPTQPAARTPTPTPTPLLSEPVHDLNESTNGLITALVAIIVFGALVVAAYVLMKGKPPGVEAKKTKESREWKSKPFKKKF